MNAIVFGLFGLIVGSFLNVLILRNGVRTAAGRSSCMSCAREILWFDLIPVLSWICLRGRCRFCHSKISAQYPLVELLTALLFAFVGAAHLPILPTILALLVSSILIATMVYDFRHTIIPDAWVWSFNALALFSVFLSTLWSGPRLPDIGVSVLAGPIVAAPLFALWLVSRGRWMGLGDAKLALGIGWLLGPFDGIAALLLAFIIGAIVGIALIALSSFKLRNIAYEFTHTLTLASLISVFHFSKGKDFGTYKKDYRASTFLQQKTMPMLVSGYTMKSEIPFGPFLIIACVFVWISQMYGISIPFLWQ